MSVFEIGFWAILLACFAAISYQAITVEEIERLMSDADEKPQSVGKENSQ